MRFFYFLLTFIVYWQGNQSTLSILGKWKKNLSIFFKGLKVKENMLRSVLKWWCVCFVFSCSVIPTSVPWVPCPVWSARPTSLSSRPQWLWAVPPALPLVMRPPVCPAGLHPAPRAPRPPLHHMDPLTLSVSRRTIWWLLLYLGPTRIPILLSWMMVRLTITFYYNFKSIVKIVLKAGSAFWSWFELLSPVCFQRKLGLFK